jgi:hypothetical protein
MQVPWGAGARELIPALQRALAAAGATAAAADGAPEAEAEQALAIGACRLLEGRGLWRHISRDWAACRALMLALLASGAPPARSFRAALSAAFERSGCRGCL